MLRYSLILIPALLLSGCGFVGGVFGARSMYEEPGYKVVEKLGEDTEIREYGPRLAAEVTVPETPGDEDEAGNDAFRILFDYISGENTYGEDVAMTTPVEMEETEGEKISMTMPVEMESSGTGGTGSTTMRFFFPRKYTMETTPKPTDDRVEILEVPGEIVAVHRYRGLRDEDRFERQKADLMEQLAGSNWRQAGDVSAFYYDPPFALPFVRRNEVLVPVERVDSSSMAETTTQQ